ncbi:MAG: S41 family peptidase [Acidobacteria bacterium]|nr:S41 family peptidase [Acidobacteriota bacterium]
MPARRSVFFKPALILFCAALLFSASCQAGGNGPWDGITGNFSPERLQADLAQMRSALESNHPDRFRYETAETLAGIFDAASASLQRDMNEVQFYRVAAPLVARYHCGHTRISPSSGFSPGPVMPLGIHLVDGKAYIDADYGSDPPVPLGREVLAINNEPIASVIGRMQAGISADALNLSARTYRLNREFYRYYYYFWGESPGFDLLLKDPANGNEATVRVAARPFTQVNGAANARFPWDGRLGFSTSGRRAVLRVPSFVASQNPDYRAFFENSFRQMNDLGIAHLVIDIRGNGGGDPDMAVALISHLARRPFVYFKKGVSYGNLFVETAPHAVHFSGTVHALIDGGCFSTSGHFCSIVRHHELAVFIGETGGGTFRCHDNSTEIVLHHTDLRLRVARTTFEAAVPDHDVSAGFPPDHRVVPTISDILSGSDPQMDFAIRLFEENN